MLLIFTILVVCGDLFCYDIIIVVVIDVVPRCGLSFYFVGIHCFVIHSAVDR